jgi:hypothetical protein
VLAQLNTIQLKIITDNLVKKCHTSPFANSPPKKPAATSPPTPPSSDLPDSVESSYSGERKMGEIGTNLKLPRTALEGDLKKKGEERRVVVGLGNGAGPVGGPSVATA